ncbi:MAG: arginine--tRNA ligase [Bacteroidota bacterium]
MSIQQILQKGISEALQSLFSIGAKPEEILLQPTRREFIGQQTLVVFPYAKPAGKSPEETGRIIGQYLSDNMPEVSGYNVVKGFLNLEIANDYWVSLLSQMHADTEPGTLPAKGEKVIIEYSSPNTNKPLHLGHLRNILLGSALSNIMKAAGFEVVRANLINDRGIHICKSMLAYELEGEGETPESAGLKGDHLIGKYYVAFDKIYKKEIADLVASGTDQKTAEKTAPSIVAAQDMLLKWEANDPETVALWQKLNDWVMAGFEETYKRLGVGFDKFYKESETYLPGKEIVQEGLKNGVFFTAPDGSVRIDLTGDGLDEKVVQRSDGTSVYITQDMGTADLKYQDFHANRSVYVVGNEQDYHFKVLFLILQKLGRPYANGLFHLSYGMVELPAGKMKSREGTVVDADDLVEAMVTEAKERSSELGKIAEFSTEEQNALFEILGLGAIKYYLLKVEPKKKMLFNPAESIELQGNTATFVQYTHARIRSIVRKAEQSGIKAEANSEYNLHPLELDLVNNLSSFAPIVQEAAERYSPALVCNYIYDLAKAYNSFFAELGIFSAEKPEQVAFRVMLSETTGKSIKTGFGLLGIGVPERM